MNKRGAFWLVILMLISLSGILTVQFYWYKNPLQMNDELFGRIVYEAMKKAILQYEINEEIRTIDEGIGNDSALFDNHLPPSAKPDYSRLKADKKIKNESLSSGGEAALEKKYPGKPVKLGLQNWNASRPIDSKRIKIIMDETLNQMGIKNPFNWALFRNGSIIQSDLTHPSGQYWYKTKLFPNDILSRDLYLGICFPGTYIYLSHHSFIRALSVISAILLCATFSLSLFLIIRLRKTSARKSDFINHMTHELKTPLTTIGLAADSILSGEIGGNKDRTAFYARLIKEENNRLNDQVEKLLQVARISRKELYFRLQKVNIHDLIRKAIEGISIQIETRGGKIEMRLEAANPVIQTDPIHFTNLVNNLLDNANKYSPEAPEILVSTSSDHKGVYISVEDKGIGISKKMQTKIFEKFYRTASEDIDNIQGFGLGLSYIKAFLKLNRGKIRVYSEAGKGSRFVVFLPF